MMIVSAISLALLVILGVNGQETEDVVTEYGTVRGQVLQINMLNDQVVPVTSFWAIPFARPPIGVLRFEPPQKHTGWSGTFVADELPAVCMQNPASILYLTHPGWRSFSENCLTLNIFKPQVVAAPASLPVLVWFHGGGYTGGGSIQYPGHFLATKDVVVVVVNYRLGVFGFASTADGTIPGNAGMLDQVLALEFIRDNIANFGGNRNRVTIFGQSAGASSAALLMVSPLSRGLYAQAILESGAENNVWTLNYPNQSPENYIYQVAENANCTTETIPEMVECLRGLPERELRIADSIECTPGYFCQGFAPTIDGPGGFMPELPLDLRNQLGTASVPIIAGHCRDDGALYTAYFIPEANEGGFTREEFQFYLRTRLVDIFAESLPSPVDVDNAYEAMDWYYTPWPNIHDEEANRQAVNKILTDGAFGYAWDRNAKINSQYAPTYTYIQSFLSPNSTSFIPEWMGVPHNGELPYVWGYGFLLQNPDVREDSGIFFDAVGWVPEDMVYADYVQTLWTNFAKYGNPTPTPVQAPFNDTMTTWPEYSITDNLKVLDLDATIVIKENYRQQDYAFYTNYMSYIGKRPVKKRNKVPVPEHKKVQFTSAQFQEQIKRTVIQALSKDSLGRYDELIEEIKRDNL